MAATCLFLDARQLIIMASFTSYLCTNETLVAFMRITQDDAKSNPYSS
jgi:hypothetical protein